MKDNRYYVPQNQGNTLDKRVGDFEQNYMISVDWLQVYCLRDLVNQFACNSFFSGVGKNSRSVVSMYEIKAGTQYHPIYKESWTVYIRDFQVCHIWCKPRSSALDARACSVKLGNRVLYSSDWNFYLHDICDALKLQIKSITRLDVCCDFQRFANGLLPNEFITKYNKDGDINEIDTYIRKYKNKYHTVAEKKFLYEVDEKGSKYITATHIENDYLRFGSRNSGVCTYLYNKTQELQESKSKNYIQEAWNNCGLIQEQDLPVYRLELSIQAKGSWVHEKSASLLRKNIDMKEVRLLSSSDIDTAQKLENVFWSYCNHYFVFYHCKGQKYRKNMPIVNLFNPKLEPTLMPRNISKCEDVGIAERNAVHCIKRLLNTYKDMEFDKREGLKGALTALELIRGKKQRDAIEVVTDDFLLELEGKGHHWSEFWSHKSMTEKQTMRIERYIQKRISEVIAPLLVDERITRYVMQEEVFRYIAAEQNAVLSEILKSPELVEEILQPDDIKCPF